MKLSSSSSSLLNLPTTKNLLSSQSVGVEPLVSLGLLLPFIAPRRWGRFARETSSVMERDEMRLYSQANFGKQMSGAFL